MKREFLGGIFILFIIGCISCSQVSVKEQKHDLPEHVILIGLDGWGAYSIEGADMPNLKRLMSNGSCSFQKRSVLPSSSAVNWASMFMGAGPELHGYTDWGSKVPELPSRVVSHYGIFPSIFGLYRDAFPEAEIGYIYEWGGMQYLAEMQVMNFPMQVMNYKENQDTTAIIACHYIKEKHPNLLAIIYDDPDGVGHRVGHDTPEYYEVLHNLDKYIGQIVSAVEDAGILDKTIFIVTSDHGGINKVHGGKTMEEMETPFIISGKGIKKNHLIEASMMQFDVASTIAYIFNLEQPQVWIGRPVMECFE